jgi:hypothetical protein
MDRPYIFLDRDGNKDLGLILLVLAPTGVEYAVEIAGSATEDRSAEGFIIPLGKFELADDFFEFFQEQFADCPNPSSMVWTQDRIDVLRDLVKEVTVWRTSPEKDVPSALDLDLGRLYELTAAWVPVTSPYGPAVLLFKNS